MRQIRLMPAFVFPAYNHVLVIKTGKHVRVKRTGRAFVLPLIQKVYEISLHPFYANGNEIYQAEDGNIRINWTAAIVPDKENLQYILDNGYNAVVEEAQQIVKRWVREVTSWTKRDDIVMKMYAFGRQIANCACQELADKGLIVAAINLHDFSFQE